MHIDAVHATRFGWNVRRLPHTHTTFTYLFHTAKLQFINYQFTRKCQRSAVCHCGWCVCAVLSIVHIQSMHTGMHQQANDAHSIRCCATAATAAAANTRGDDIWCLGTPGRCHIKRATNALHRTLRTNKRDNTHTHTRDRERTRVDGERTIIMIMIIISITL